MARPSKLTKEWLEVAEEVVNDDINAIILTDEELVMEINDKLDDEDAEISHRTFQRWKAKNKDGKEGELDEIGKEFCRLIKAGLRKQKRHLFEKFRDKEETQWQKYAWIIERKFDDWNLKQKTELSGDKDKPIAILGNVSANDSDKKDN